MVLTGLVQVREQLASAQAGRDQARAYVAAHVQGHSRVWQHELDDIELLEDEVARLRVERDEARHWARTQDRREWDPYEPRISEPPWLNDPVDTSAPSLLEGMRAQLLQAMAERDEARAWAQAEVRHIWGPATPKDSPPAWLTAPTITELSGL